jgi:hypothetical protein
MISEHIFLCVCCAIENKSLLDYSFDVVYCLRLLWCQYDGRYYP